MKTFDDYVLDKFVVCPSGCWLVKPGHNFGYGHFTRGRKGHLAHRLAYSEWVGDIPPGQSILHKCDVPNCINPAHLFVGSQADNMHDRNSKGRMPRQDGVHNPSARLTESDVRDIRALRAFLTQTETASLYGVSRTNIEAIQVGRSWKHVR